jgi:hypothetical protein
MAELLLPARLTLQTLPFLCNSWPDDGEVRINFGNQGWVLPSGIVGLSCLVEAAIRRGQYVTCSLQGCQNASYWQRMGFCARFGVRDAPAAGVRRAARSRFSELKRISDIEEVDAITEGLIEVTALSPEARDIYGHVVSEALNNVCQHSGAAGYCMSQFYPSARSVRFCIADCGQGLRSALSRFAPESDEAAILKALEVGVSGRSQAEQLAAPKELRNRGVGLTAIQRLVVENEGEIIIWSGEAFYREQAGLMRGFQPPSAPWRGTLLAARLPRNQFSRSFRDIMRELTAELKAHEVRRQRWTRQP